MNIDRYLKRLKISDIETDKLNMLKLIQRSHLEQIPFENFDIHMYGKLNFDIDVLFEKIIEQRRGGICYELNYLLFHLLKLLGYQVTILAGQVLEGGSEFDHLFLLVKIDEIDYLVDVGYGDNFYEPLRFETEKIQNDAKGKFRITKGDDNRYSLERESSDGFKREYRFSVAEKEIDDFHDRALWFCTNDESIFKKRLFCSIERKDGRTSMKPGKVIVTNGNTRVERVISDFKKFEYYLKEEFNMCINDKFNLIKKIYDEQGPHVV